LLCRQTSSAHTADLRTTSVTSFSNRSDDGLLLTDHIGVVVELDSAITHP
jgi:hypothetical protein